MAGGDLACHKKVAAAQGAWLVFEDEAGQNLRPPHGRTWGRRGHTPVVKVCAASSGRISIAGLVATKPDRPTRLIFRTRVHRGRKGERKGFSERDYAALLDAAHQQLGGPIVLVWDNLNTHLSNAMTGLIATRDWLTAYQLPPYAPELNPVEAVWSHLKRSLANLTKRIVDQLLWLIKSRLRRIQHRPELTTGFVTKIGLDFKPPNSHPSSSLAAVIWGPLRFVPQVNGADRLGREVPAFPMDRLEVVPLAMEESLAPH